MASASADSAEVSVNLSDPNTFPLSSTGKWTGYLEFLGKPGTERSLGQPDLFIPFLQDTNDMTFLNIRGQLQFDNTDVSEYNIGLGHRHMFQEWILGGYGYFDHRNTQLNNAYRQFTGGLELMSVDWAFRMNGYLPENKTETSTSGANVSVIRPGDQINVQVDGIVQEKALPGLDGEVGYLLPIPWKAYTAVFDETRVYAGGYHFLGEDQFESVTGPRGRVEWRAYDLPVLGPGSRLMMGVEAQWDEPRGSQAFGLASLRIPLDVFSDKSKRRKLTGLDRRMLQPVIRDVDVVTSEHNVPAEILPALNQAGQAYTKAVDVTTVEEMEEAIANNDGEVLAIFLKGNEDLAEEVMDGDDRHMWESGQFSLGKDQTLASAGIPLLLRHGASRYLPEGSIDYTEAGTPVGLLGSIEMGHGTQLNGLLGDATDFDYGVTLSSDDPLVTAHITRSTIMNAVQAGAYVEGEGRTLFLSEDIFTGNTTAKITDGVPTRLRHDAAIVAKGGGRIEAQYVTVSENHFAGVLSEGDGSSVLITDSMIWDNDDRGLSAGYGGLLEAHRMDLRRNNSTEVAAFEQGRLFIYDSILADRQAVGERGVNDKGLGAWSSGFIFADNVDIYDKEWGSIIFGSSTVVIQNSRIYGNEIDGINVDGNGNTGPFFEGYNANLLLDNVQIYGNGEDGSMSWGAPWPESPILASGRMMGMASMPMPSILILVRMNRASFLPTM